MRTVELAGYRLHEPMDHIRLPDIDFRLEAGEIRLIEAPSSGWGHLFLKGLATLSYPEAGTYRFKGERLDFSDYRHLLPVKRRIGYVGPTSALISNLSIRENLMIARHYFEDSLECPLHDFLEDCCRLFDLRGKFDLRPAMLDPLDQRTVIILRELDKRPDLLILDSADDLFSHRRFSRLIPYIRSMVDGGTAMVLMTENDQLLKAFDPPVFDFAEVHA